MIAFPKIEDLKKQFKEVMSNKDIERISYWIEPNTAPPTDEKKYLANALRNIKKSKKKMRDVLSSISNTE